MSPDDIERYWAKVNRAGASECWLWTGATSGGYGRFNIGGKIVLAHRLSLEMHSGQTGTCALHSCNNPRCVNPLHLRWGTPADNVSDAVKAGRKAVTRGDLSWSHKLSSEQVTSIRLMCKTHTQASVAKLFGVSSQQVSKIVNLTSWKHLKD